MSESHIIELELSSGFVVEVKPLPPYYMDVIKLALPDKEYPERTVINIAGDEFSYPYEPPKDAPKIEDREEYDLYYEWKSVEAHNATMKGNRNRAREDFLLSMCIDVKSGPIELDDEEWKLKLEAVFYDHNFKVPTHYGAKLLLFLKSVVISKPEEKELLIHSALYTEVDMQGIYDALQGFRN